MAVARSSLSLYLAEIRAHPRLDADEEARVARAVRSDRASLVRLMEANLSFVVKIAKEFRGQGLPFEDLISEGNLGLVDAARRFDPARGVKFITYAVFWIRKSIRRALAQQSSLIRVPDYQRRKARGGGVGGGWVASRRGHVSLDRPFSEDGDARLADLLESPRIGPEAELAEREAHRLLRDAVSALGPRSRAILVHRLGLGDREPVTLRELAARLGLSHERVRQIEGEARRELRARLGGRGRS